MSDFVSVLLQGAIREDGLFYEEGSDVSYVGCDAIEVAPGTCVYSCRMMSDSLLDADGSQTVTPIDAPNDSEGVPISPPFWDGDDPISADNMTNRMESLGFKVTFSRQGASR